MTQILPKTPRGRVLALALGIAISAGAVLLMVNDATADPDGSAAPAPNSTTTTDAPATTAVDPSLQVERMELNAGPADIFVAPQAAGAGDGSSPQDAARLDQLDDLIVTAGPGGVIELLPGEYQVISPVVIRHGGSPGSPVTIRGPADGPVPTLTGERVDPYQAGGEPGKPLFRLEAGADHLQFARFDCARVGNGCFIVTGPIVDLLVTDVTASNVRRFFENGSGDEGTATITGLEISDVTITGFSKGAIRLGHDTNDVLIADVVGDSQAQDGDNFAMGVHLIGTVHDVVIDGVTMDNARDTIHDYWNGDGFAAESGTHHIVFIDTSASGNTDAGYDIKASDVLMTGAVASGNKRNFRLSGSSIRLENCVGDKPVKQGGTGTQAQIHAWGSATAELVNCEFSDLDPATIVFDVDEHADLVVVGALVEHDINASLSDVDPGASLQLEMLEEST